MSENSQIEFTPAEIERLRGLCAAATPGPWELMDPIEEDFPVDYEYQLEVNQVIPGWLMFPTVARVEICSDNAGERTDEDRHNGEFIAAARSALPAALDEIERLRAQVKRKQAAIRYALNNIGPKLDNAICALKEAYYRDVDVSEWNDEWSNES